MNRSMQWNLLQDFMSRMHLLQRLLVFWSISHERDCWYNSSSFITYCTDSNVWKMHENDKLLHPGITKIEMWYILYSSLNSRNSLGGTKILQKSYDTYFDSVYPDLEVQNDSEEEICIYKYLSSLSYVSFPRMFFSPLNILVLFFF